MLLVIVIAKVASITLSLIYIFTKNLYSSELLMFIKDKVMLATFAITITSNNLIFDKHQKFTRIQIFGKDIERLKTRKNPGLDIYTVPLRFSASLTTNISKPGFLRVLSLSISLPKICILVNF
jgi:hypothetical protein